eukprot:TRINITY_DN16867_c0_g1_i1.p1 TRINITY_DN16867_c0_g1~~TRINITY_DN16867_c0_g1_i1.p1  ORF type:complete len:263 (+),score=122.86 TRINITY_DN16867_c0_g1_i1:57-845(+)
MALRTSRLLASKVNVALQGDRGVFTLTSGAVNVLNRETLTEATRVLGELEQQGVRGLVVTGAGKVFSAGLDINEFAAPTEGALREYWGLVQAFWLKLYASKITTVAAVNGAAPAAGTMVALGCDYRVMTDNPKAKIGLNEPKLGLAAPYWLAEAYVDVFSVKRRGELATIRGDLFSPQAALAEGIVDELAAHEDVHAAAEARLTELLAIPTLSVQMHKELFRNAQAERLEANLAKDKDSLVRCIMDPAVQQCITRYLASLKK